MEKKSRAKIQKKIKKKKKIRLNRWLQVSTNDKYSLHGFADASEKAYAAACYLHVIDVHGKHKVNLIAAKSCVAPIKTLTIPKLELQAAQLLARLMIKVKTALNILDIECFAWSDSTIVLSWLRHPPTLWKVYVTNRVTQIQSLIPTEHWRHVPTELNAADCVTRGLSVEQLNDFELWWHGPDFLKNEREMWPTLPAMEAGMDKIYRAPKILNTRVERNIETQKTNDILRRFSNLYRLQRFTAKMKRWCKRKPVSEFLTTIELKAALMFWVSEVQKQYFTDEFRLLSSGRNIPRSSSLITLHPQFDEQYQILRVGGRLEKSSLDHDAKHQVILPFGSELSHLIIDHAHKHVLHGGVQATLRFVRERFWIIRGRIMVKAQLAKCITCFRYKKQTPNQLMGQLPTARVQMSRPFAHTGVDFAGYFEVKTSNLRNASFTKCYVALFICMCTRAIHLELVRDLSTQAFLDAIKNFVGRRGLPSDIYSDNGTNFVGAKNELPRLLADSTSSVARDVHEILLTENIQWHFNPARAPHFGGLWESNIKQMKLHMTKILADKKLRFEEFYTVLIQIEACLNSRPLCVLRDDDDEPEMLTPSHLLHGFALKSVPEPDITCDGIGLLDRYHEKQKLYQQFWKIWSNDYLNEMQKRTKWQQAKANFIPGHLVIVMEDNVPPSRWLLGRVVSVSPGADGLVRTAIIKIGKSLFSRPIHKLCLLPSNEEGQ